MNPKPRAVYRKVIGVTLALLLPNAGALFADDRDDKIEDAFKNTYVYRTQLRGAAIDIDSENGRVTLKGKAADEDQKRLAEDTARSLPGVNDVVNRIDVASNAKESSDEWIAAKVRSALLFKRGVSLADQDVNVRDGVVTLTGTAATDAEKALAGEYAADIKGVKRVDNQIRVVPVPKAPIRENDAPARAAGSERAQVDHDRVDRSDRTVGERIDDASITARAKAALATRRSTSAFRTNVTTRDGVVSVTGEAKNAAEKDLVTIVIKNIDGVRDVRNDMRVSSGME